ncbi:MAG: M20/M25/M40 family metallo-hydrolase [Desulfurococcaceae archaeon]
MYESELSKIVSSSFKYINTNYDKYVDLLRSLIAFKSVSAWRGEDLHSCARYLFEIFRERGYKAEVKSKGGAPVVLAEIGSGSRSLLFYNHYDVQPPDPIELWESDPFTMNIKGDYAFGRGTSDNKGNIVARIAAIDSLTDYLEKLDLKIRFLIEGEEEIGSPSLPNIVKENLGWVKSDGGVWETASVGRDGSLEIPLGFKGMLYVEIKFKGPNRDVHSGLAPLVPNPAWKLIHLLAKLKSPEGDILLPGIGEGVDEEFIAHVEMLTNKLSHEEIDKLREELELASFLKDLKGREALRELYSTPSLNISGLYAGYTGKGSKTVIPSVAGVKIDIRPVPGQDPERLLEALRKYILELGYQEAEIEVLSMYPSGYTKPSEFIVKASASAAKEIYGREPKLTPLSGGSGPIYIFTGLAKTPMTGAGVGYYGSRAHSPNENIRLTDFKLGIKHVVMTVLNFSQKE